MTQELAIAHSQRAHSSVGGSSAKRIMECPGSMLLCEKYPSKSSEYAEEGTAGHEAIDMILQGKTKNDRDVIGLVFNKIVITEEFFEEAIAPALQIFDALDKLGREHGFFVTDDGLGRVVFTTSGVAGIERGDHIERGTSSFLSGDAKRSGRERFSTYVVKGQTAEDEVTSGDATDADIDDFREYGSELFREARREAFNSDLDESDLEDLGAEIDGREAEFSADCCRLEAWHEKNGSLNQTCG